MKFESIEVEDYYMELQSRFGYFHANFGSSIVTLEDLKNLENFMVEFKKKYNK